MGMNQHDHAERLARLAPPVSVETQERGHGRGAYVDRSRTDGIELRGVPCVGRGITGAMRHSRPGIDSAAALERDERELTRTMMRAARGNLKRARRKDHQP